MRGLLPRETVLAGRSGGTLSRRFRQEREKLPKRIVDGEGLWGSDKLLAVQPEWVRAEYANLIPLALSNGAFECSVRRVWRDVYSYNRPSMTEKRVALILDSLERAKLLFRFQCEGKTWGFWTGIDRPGRLPPISRQGSNEKTGAVVPVEQLRCFLMDADCIHSEANGIHTEASGIPPAKPEPEPEPKPKPLGFTAAEKKTQTPDKQPPTLSEGNGGRGSGEGEEPFDLPPWVPEREWLDFVAMRLNIRRPIKTASQAEYCIRQLQKLRDAGNDPAEVLAQSIAANWQGLFAVKGRTNGTTVAEQNRKNAAIAFERFVSRGVARGSGPE